MFQLLFEDELERVSERRKNGNTAGKRAEKDLRETLERYERIMGEIAAVFFNHKIGTEEQAMHCILPVFQPLLEDSSLES